MSETIVGIDLGTTNTLACYQKGGKARLIKFKSDKMLPSVLYVTEDKKIIIGSTAKKMGINDPQNCIMSSKTYMGDPDKKWNCRGLVFTPTDVATEILREVRRAIMKKFSLDESDVIKAIITVPAYFNSNQKDETRTAGRRAGFEVMGIKTEPMAAAVAAVQDVEEEQKVLVVDLGGGTFDLSILKADPAHHEYTAISIDGDRHLGGDDFDKCLLDYFIECIKEDGADLSSLEASGMSYNEYYSALGSLREAAEQAKIDLSSSEETEIDLPNLYQVNGKLTGFALTLMRQDFDSVCQPLYDSITNRIKKFLKRETAARKIKANEIRYVVLAGGSCYILYIQKAVEGITAQPARTDNLSTLVVYGASLIADALSSGISDGGEGIIVKDILSHSLGVAVLADSGKEELSKILQKGQEYPCEADKVYTTTRDNMTTIEIEVYEAGSDQENNPDIEMHDFYGLVKLEGIEKAKSGQPQIRVTFSYDESGCLTVRAEDEKTKAAKEIKIEKGSHKEIVHHTAAQPIDFMLLMDTSYSMAGNALKQAKRASQSLIHDMIDFSTHRLGLISFNNAISLMSPLTQDVKRLDNAIEAMEATGGTDMYTAFTVAERELSTSKNERVIIVVTDGQPFGKENTLEYAESLKRDGYRIVVIGAGDVDRSFNRQLASKGDDYSLSSMAKLQGTFQEIVQKLTERH